MYTLAKKEAKPSDASPLKNFRMRLVETKPQVGTPEPLAVSDGSLANGTRDSHALRASGRATRMETRAMAHRLL